jgi:hypothetical protein
VREIRILKASKSKNEESPDKGSQKKESFSDTLKDD